jgi:glutaredoxin
MAERVILYTAPGCGTSDRARRELLAEGVELEERDVMKDKRWFEDVLRYSIFVPIVVRESGKVEIGWKGRVG